MRAHAYHLSRPQLQTTPVVFASPHSGRRYDTDFLDASVLDSRAIRSSEDAFVDHLFAHAVRAGAPFLAAQRPRAYVDLNRSCDELDPALIEGVRAQPQNPRIVSGLGVIPRVVAQGRAIYHGKMSRAHAEMRLAEVWQPYHDQLSELLSETRAQFGEAVLIDCHSMPREALVGLTRRGVRRPDVVIGDLFGASASGWIVDRIEAAFERAGFYVARNTPFAGAYIVQTYGRPSKQQHAVQIEIDRGLYLDEATVAPSAGLAPLRRRLRGVIEEIAQIGAVPMPLAAE